MGYKERVYKEHSLISRKKLGTVPSLFEKIKEQSDPCFIRNTCLFHQGKEHFVLRKTRCTVIDRPEK